MTDQDIAVYAGLHLRAHAQFFDAGNVWYEGEVEFARAIEAAVTAPLLERIAELEALSKRLKQEAQCHAQEAHTANATIAEIYQVCSGGTGEPGNWHGAEPVRQKLAELGAKLAQLVPDGPT